MSRLRSLKPYKGALQILTVGAVFFALVGIRDSVWTPALYANKWPIFTDVMSRSVFNGELPGMSDVGVIAPIVAFFIWLVQRDPEKQVAEWHLQRLKFIFLSGIFAPMITVQSFKWLVSRARPRVFLSEVLPVRPDLTLDTWLPGFMGVFGPRGYSWNSFPSGHASTCAVLLVFCYAYGTSTSRKVLAGMAVLLLTGLMAIARSMAGMHWVSDSVASFFIAWSVIDIVYQRVIAKSQVS